LRKIWQDTRAFFARSIATFMAAQQFQDARRTMAIFARFESIAALIAYLTTRGGDLDEKDRRFALLGDGVARGSG